MLTPASPVAFRIYGDSPHSALRGAHAKRVSKNDKLLLNCELQEGRVIFVSVLLTTVSPTPSTVFRTERILNRY